MGRTGGDKPLYANESDESSRVMNLTRVETFGDEDVHWVRATIDIRDPEVYSFQSEKVDENVGP